MTGQEDPMRNNCLEPQSLVMTRSECFYCFGEEGSACYTISYNFGIKSCDLHYAASVRDCKAYIHRKRIIPLLIASKNIQLKPFFDILADGFPVLRSSGAIDDGWIIHIGNFYDAEMFGYNNMAQSWVIPIKKMTDDIYKRIYIKTKIGKI